jgi:Uma2 family endonuclease
MLRPDGMAEEDRFTQRSQRGNECATQKRDDVVSEMRATTTEAYVPERPITVAEFHRMGEAGLIGPDDRVELLDGRLIPMPPVGPDHQYSVDTLVELLTLRFAGRAFVRGQAPLALDDISEPQPDVTLNVLPRQRYAQAHATPAEVLLAIEVSKSSLALDKGRKLRAYSRRGIAEYWIVNLMHDRIDVYRGPVGERFAKHLIVGRGGTLAPEAFPADAFAVDDVLPPLR